VRRLRGGRKFLLHLLVCKDAAIDQVHVLEQRVQKIKLMHAGSRADRGRRGKQHGKKKCDHVARQTHDVAAC
jgi:hypothetical protein